MMDNVLYEQAAANEKFDIAVKSVVGGRTEQQDRAYIHSDDAEIFALVCDGMGGAVAGADASEETVSTIHRLYLTYRHDHGTEPPVFLHQAMIFADRNVSRRIAHKVGGTTLVAALIQNGFLFWLSVGDSRLYIFRDNELLQVTRDHNYFLRLDELKSNRMITDAVYHREQSRGEALISYIGLGKIELYDLTQTGLELRAGDLLLLATDGVFKELDHSFIQEMLRGNASCQHKADCLIDESTKHAIAAGREQDNATLVLIGVRQRGKA